MYRFFFRRRAAVEDKAPSANVRGRDLMLRAVLLVAACCATAGSGAGYGADEQPVLNDNKLSVSLPYQAESSEPVQHEVDYAVVITPPYHCQVLKVWVPVPPSDGAQVIRDWTISAFPQAVKPQIHDEPVFGNRFAYFEFREPQGAQIIRQTYSATVSNLHWKLDLSKVEAITEWPQEFDVYLQPQPIADRQQWDDVIAGFSRDASPLRRLHNAFSWIEDNLTYDHASASLTADADTAFRQRRGHCSDYHGLCATMGRTLGWPSRMTYGLSLFPKNSPSHCKLEVFLPPYGWVSFDLSETQKLVQSLQRNAQLTSSEKERLIQAARTRLLSGFRENSWLLQTRGSNYQLAPPATQPVPVIRTIYAEADGVPLPEPDPANPQQREFAWMTVHQFKSDRQFHMPFKDLETLAPYAP